MQVNPPPCVFVLVLIGRLPCVGDFRGRLLLLLLERVDDERIQGKEVAGTFDAVFGNPTLIGSRHLVRNPWKARALTQNAHRSLISSGFSHKELRPSTILCKYARSDTSSGFLRYSALDQR